MFNNYFIITNKSCVWGKLSEKNDPDALLSNEDYALSNQVLQKRNPDLFEFPTNGTVYRLGHDPYMEAVVGVDNIFKVLRVEYIRRLNYLNHPGVSKHGVQIAVAIAF